MPVLNARGALRWVAALVVFAAPALGAQQTPDTLRLTVEEAVSRILRASDESRIADAQVDLADAAVTTARAAGLPQLRLNASNQQVLKNARAEIVGAVFNQPYVYQANLNLQQTLFQGGRIFAASKAASQAQEAAKLTRDETRALLAVQAQAAYLNAVFTARIAEIQATNLQLAGERVTQAEQMERAGRASRYDVLRARVERDNLEPELRAAEAARTLAELELRRLLDIPPEQPIALITALDGNRVRQMADDARARSANERAAVRAAELTAQARRASIRVARADLLPSITAGFTYGFLAFPSSPAFPTRSGDRDNSYCAPGAPPTQQCQNNGWFPDRSFTIQMTWPLFDGLRAKGQVDQAQAQTRIAEAQARQMREAASIEVQQAQAELARAQAVAAARETTVREAEEAYELSTLRLARGVGTQLEVSDAQLALLRARSTDARAIFDLYLAVAELARVRAEPIPLPDGSTVPTRVTN